jgi:aldose 1-epimerase
VPGLDVMEGSFMNRRWGIISKEPLSIDALALYRINKHGKMNKIAFVAVWVGLVAMSCTKSVDSDELMMKREDFQIGHQGKDVDLYTLRNDQSMVVQITNYGAKIVSIIVPDREGNLADVCLGYESAQAYIEGIASLGATMGRVTNRIANAQFTLNDSTYHLAKNNGQHTIHGGESGFRFKVWDGKQVDRQQLELSYFSEDGEEGFPGNLKVKVTFSLTNDNELKLEYHATTDKPTVVNFTNHAFFNLAGEGSETVLDHQLMVNAEYYTPVDSTAIPTGQILSVAETPLDFRQLTTLGERINDDFEQLRFVGGYDHNFVLRNMDGGLILAALLHDPASGRVMEVKTTEPGLQVYTANSLSRKDTGKGGKVYGPQSSICLETQHFPDSPNHPNFPSTVLNPGKEFTSSTVYKFSSK